MHNLLLLIVALFVTVLPAQDDRDRSTPVERQWLTNQTPAAMTALQTAGWRFTDIERTSSNPLEFAVAMVKNTGTYQKTWTFTTAASAAQLTALVQQNMRIVDLEADSGGSGLQFAAILIANTGADAKGWWWGYNDTSAQVDSAVNANNGRLVCLKRYVPFLTPVYAWVMISNTGADQRGWGYLYGASGAAIGQTLATGLRVYAMERVFTDSYDTIFIDNPQGHGSWFYDGISLPAAQEVLDQNLGRVVDVQIYIVTAFPVAQTRCTVSIIDAANTLERSARNDFLGAAAGALGDYGFFLKEVGGSVLASMRPDTQFEPASTMKTLYHVHVMRRVALGQWSLAGLLNKPVACGVPGANQSLQSTLSQMMEVSDNMATLAISNAFGINNIDATAGALGMTSTSVNFTIGCSGPSPESAMTLRDLSTLHEQVVGGYLAPGVLDWRPTFYSLMQESLSFPSWGTDNLSTRIDNYAVLLGMSAAGRDVFKDKLHIAYKPGGIGWAPSGTPDYYYAEGGWMSVPFRAANGLLAPREYTFGVFNHFFHTQEVSGRNAMCDAELELVWDRVRAAMDTWDDYVAGSITSLPGAGCAGSGGVPVQTCVSLPDLEETVIYGLDDAPGSAIVITMFGFSASSWSGVPLPADLGPIGAPGCILRTEPSVMLAAVAAANGAARTPIVIGADPATIGAVWFSQFLVLDPPANPFGMTVSNALRTQIGGSS